MKKSAPSKVNVGPRAGRQNVFYTSHFGERTENMTYTEGINSWDFMDCINISKW